MKSYSSDGLTLEEFTALAKSHQQQVGVGDWKKVSHIKTVIVFV